MNENNRILQLADLCIAQMEQGLNEPGAKLDIKAINEYGKAMKSMMDIVRECKAQQMMIQPIEVIMGEGEKYAN